MERKQNVIPIIIVIGIVVMGMLIVHNFSLSNQLNQVAGVVRDLRYDHNRLSEQLDAVIEKMSIISDTDYRVETIENGNEVLAQVVVDITSNKLGSYTDVKLLYRKTYDFTKADNYDYSSEEWQAVELKEDHGIYLSEFTVPFSCNYELQVSLQENNHLNYEELPELDLYTKSEYAFMKDINIYKVKDNKLKFDVQIAKFKKDDYTKLLEAICHIYYGDDIVKSFDILKENEISGRKEPKKQLEHLDGEYWFIIEEVDFSDRDIVDESKITIEIILKDSKGNTYKETRGVN